MFHWESVSVVVQKGISPQGALRMHRGPQKLNRFITAPVGIFLEIIPVAHLSSLITVDDSSKQLSNYEP